MWSSVGISLLTSVLQIHHAPYLTIQHDFCVPVPYYTHTGSTEFELIIPNKKELCNNDDGKIQGTSKKLTWKRLIKLRMMHLERIFLWSGQFFFSELLMRRLNNFTNVLPQHISNVRLKLWVVSDTFSNIIKPTIRHSRSLQAAIGQQCSEKGVAFLSQGHRFAYSFSKWVRKMF